MSLLEWDILPNGLVLAPTVRELGQLLAECGLVILNCFVVVLRAIDK
jgi:hypothetical protein